MNMCVHEYNIIFYFRSPLQQPNWDSFHRNGIWQISVWHQASDFTGLLWSLSDCPGWSIWKLRRAAQENNLSTKEVFHKQKVSATENPDKKPKINNFPLTGLFSIAASMPVHLLQDLSSSQHSSAPRHRQHPAGLGGASLGIFGVAGSLSRAQSCVWAGQACRLLPTPFDSLQMENCDFWARYPWQVLW